MSPPRRPARGRAGGARATGGRAAGEKKPARRKRRGRGRGAGIVVALLGLVAAGIAAVALYLGFLRGPWSPPVGGRADSAGPDSGRVLDLAKLPSADSVASDSLVGAGDVPAAADEPSGLVSVEDSVAGDALYRGQGRCLGCHGSSGEGVAGLGPGLREAVGRLAAASPDSIAQVVRWGAPPSARFRLAMPSYRDQLADEDVARVAAFVYTLSHPGSTRTDGAGADSAGAGHARVEGVGRPTVPAAAAPVPVPPPARP